MCDRKRFWCLLWWLWCQTTTCRSPSRWKAATEWSCVRGCSSHEQKKMAIWGSFWCTHIPFWVVARVSWEESLLGWLSMVTPLPPLTWGVLANPLADLLSLASLKLRMSLLSPTGSPTLSLFLGFCWLVLPQVLFPISQIRSLKFVSIFSCQSISHDPLSGGTHLAPTTNFSVGESCFFYHRFSSFLIIFQLFSASREKTHKGVCCFKQLTGSTFLCISSSHLLKCTFWNVIISNQ